MVDLNDVREWLERLRAKDLGPTGDYARLLLAELDTSTEQDDWLDWFCDRVGCDRGEENDAFERMAANAQAWVELRERLVDADLITDDATHKQIAVILGMFLPLD